jgi:hypothetical protein
MAKHPDSQIARQWRDRLRRFDKSHLTVAEFCQIEDYTVASFYYWRRKLRFPENSTRPPAFVSVDVPVVATPQSSSAVGLRISLPGGAVLRLGLDATDEQQRRLIRNVVDSLREVQS